MSWLSLLPSLPYHIHWSWHKFAFVLSICSKMKKHLYQHQTRLISSFLYNHHILHICTLFVIGIAAHAAAWLTDVCSLCSEEEIELVHQKLHIVNLSCLIQRHVSLSWILGWSIQKRCFLQNAEYKICVLVSCLNFLCRFWRVSIGNRFCFAIHVYSSLFVESSWQQKTYKQI